jgi:hypothetical protein
MDVALPWRRVPQTTVIVGAVVAVIALSLGAYAGLRSPWGAKHAQVASGVAMRANPENDLVMSDADDGEQLNFHAGGVRWETEGVEGAGDPPCLRTPLAKAKVEVGHISVTGPGGGRFPQVVWVKCL